MYYNDKDLNCPKDIINSFADHFSESFVNDQPPVNLNCSSLNKNVLCITSINEENVTAAIRKLKPKITCGPDQIPAFVVRDCANVFAKPLKFLFNLILKTSTFPHQWKVSRICPVHKKGDKANIKNYRPIAIMCNFAKVFEIVLHIYLSNHVSQMLSLHQHGFIKGRSTVTNLVTMTQFLCESLDDQRQVDVVYTDFSKAFDKIDHNLLLQKLETFGMSDSLILLLRSYLENRYLFVKMNGFESKLFKQETGVPQGSVLGPLLFNLFINDLPEVIDVPALLFADDLKIYSIINSNEDSQHLQNCIDEVHNWCSNNNLELNKSKCMVMTFSKKTKPLMFNYTVDGTTLHRPEVIQDLGVTFDPKLSFVNHVQQITQSAFKSLGFVLRNGREFADSETLKILYMAYCRSRLEYASVVWSPIHNIHISALENIQRRFLKNLAHICDGVYPPRGYPQELLLSRFNMSSLLIRRTEHSIILLFNIVNGTCDCPAILFNIPIKVNRINSRRKNTFYLPTARTSCAAKSPLLQLLFNYADIENDIDIFSSSVKSIKVFFTLKD